MSSTDPPQDALPDFSGKCVVLYLASVPLHGATTLHSPTFQRHAGKMFLVGDVMASQRGRWASGRRAGVAWEEVVQYIIFDSHEEYSAMLKSHAAQAPKSFRLLRRRKT